MEAQFNLPSSDDVEAWFQSIPDDKTRRAMKEMMQIMMANQEKIDKRIMELSDFCKELDQRLREKERYSLKDFIIISNPPYDPKDGALISSTIKFFKTYLTIELKAACLKTCHILIGKKQQPYVLIPAVINKFVYFEEKKSGVQSTKAANREKNPLNGKNINNNERFPPMESIIKPWADHTKLNTTTKNLCSLGSL